MPISLRPELSTSSETPPETGLAGAWAPWAVEPQASTPVAQSLMASAPVMDDAALNPRMSQQLFLAAAPVARPDPAEQKWLDALADPAYLQQFFGR